MGNAALRRPNLFVIGTAKAGTTSLHSHLSRHPDVFMSDPKEPAFFVPEIDRWPKDPRWYLGLFEGADDATFVGESSTHYTKIPLYEGVPERIAAFCEDPRFIYVMRDPIDRIVSHYWYEVAGRVEHRSLMEAVRKDPQYRAISDYEMQLEPYFELFGRDRVLLMTFERLVEEQERALTELYRWLGLDPNLVTLELPRKNERADEVEMRRGFGFLDRFSRSALWDALYPYAPSFVKSIGSRLAREKVDPSEVDRQQLIQHLRPEFQAKVRKLESFLGCEFPRWTTTFPPVREPGVRAAE